MGKMASAIEHGPRAGPGRRAQQCPGRWGRICSTSVRDRRQQRRAPPEQDRQNRSSEMAAQHDGFRPDEAQASSRVCQLTVFALEPCGAGRGFAHQQDGTTSSADETSNTRTWGRSNTASRPVGPRMMVTCELDELTRRAAEGVAWAPVEEPRLCVAGIMKARRCRQHHTPNTGQTMESPPE